MIDKNIEKLKAELAKDLEIIQQFEALMARRGLSTSNGSSASAPQMPPLALPPPVLSPRKTRKRGHTGLQDLILSAIDGSPAGAGIRANQIVAKIIASGYPHSTKQALTGSVSTGLRRLLETGRIRRDGLLYHPILP